MDFSFLDEINKIVNKYEEDNRITGKNINILQIAGKDHNEVVICKLIAFFLNPDEKHSQKEKFLNLFLKKIYEPIVSEDELKSLQIITEFPANRRRIDIVIKSNKRFLPIEVKIWATDQEAQCNDYYIFAKEQKPVGAKKVFYLTIDGHKPNESSLGELKEGENLIILSFRNHILQWLEQCEIEKEKFTPMLQEFIRELKLAVRKFCGYTENQEMNEEILKIITNEKNLEATKAICAVEKEIRPELLWEEFCKKISGLECVDFGYERDEKNSFTVCTEKIDIIFSNCFDYIFIGKTEDTSSSDIQNIREKLIQNDFECSEINKEGFVIKNVKTYFFDKSFESVFDLYYQFKNKSDAILNRIKIFVELLYEIEK